MIRVITRCLGSKKLEEHKWDWHFACFHFKSYKNCYLNGKPLKPYHILKNGDVVEIVERPKGIFTLIGAAIFGSILFGASTTTFTVLGVLTVGLAVAAVGAIATSITGAFSQGITSSTTQNKEYSSSSQPELRGASNDISDGILPILFGKTQQTPSYGQLPYRLVSDGSSTNKYRQYFVPNYKNVVYSDFKLGETPVTNYSIDYLDIITSSGSNNFIGFDNVKVDSIDEELSYNAEEEVNQSAIYYYNEPDNITSINIRYKIQFSNLKNILNFSRKTFTTIVRVIQNDVLTELSEDVTIIRNNITQVSDTVYEYVGEINFPDLTDITELVSVQCSPSTNTRNNDGESTDELDCLYVNQTIITNDKEYGATLNESINKYQGTVSEVCSTSPSNTKDIDVIIGFPQGLYKLNQSNAERLRRSTIVEIMYKTEGEQYQPISSANALYIRDINGNKLPLTSTNTTVNGAKVTMYSPDDMNVADQLFYRVIGFTLPKGKYTVRVRSADFSAKTNYDVGSPSCSEIQYYVDGDVLSRDILPRVNQISFEAIAYKGLSGTLKKFNYIAEARIPIWNGEDWNTIAKTENPASIVRYLLTDKDCSPRPIDLNLIDNDSLVHYYNWCETQGYKASGIVSDEVKTLDVVNEILSNSQGAMIPMLNGKHTFAIDGHDGKLPKGLFNQHNSWDFTWSPSIGRLTEAIRASFINNIDYTTEEVTVYWYNGTVHTEIKPNTTDEDYLLVKKDLKYINDKESVIKSISYELETIQTRRDTFEFKTNLEALNMTLLDRFYVTNSSNMQNEKTGLIKEVLTKDGDIIGFRLYSIIDIPENSQIIVRSLDYVDEVPLINIFDVLNGGKSADKVLIQPIPYNNQIRGQCEIKGLQDKWVYDGDLFAIGQGTIYDCVATDIKYNEDNTATITARKY